MFMTLAFGMLALILTVLGALGISLTPYILQRAYWARGDIVIPSLHLVRTYYVGLRMVLVSTNLQSNQTAEPLEKSIFVVDNHEHAKLETASLWSNASVCAEVHNTTSEDDAYRFCMGCKETSEQSVLCVLMAVVSVFWVA
jgi:hypothetical protein